MKKRDLYWVNRIIIFLVFTLLLAAISILNILQFNSSYMEEEREELHVFKRQIEWAIAPILEQNDFEKLQQYCDDFRDEDSEFRIFDENKNLIATSNPENKTPLLAKDSKILHKDYSKYKIYRFAIKNKKIGIREKYYVNGHKYYIELTISQADVMKSILNAQKSVLIFFAFCILFFILALIQVFYSIRQSFNKLEDSVIEVANGNLDVDINIPDIDLLKELTISIKKMVQRLKTQITRLSQLEQYKSNFLQNITHEIKTPITAINSAIELLDSRNSITEADKECFDIIQFQIKSINKLVNDILCLSEIEVEKTGEHKNFEMFELNSAVRNVISEFSYSGLEINLIENESVTIYADLSLISTAISNLISNAIKYSQTNKIDIILNKSELIVKDYGIGIEKEHLEHLFERFYRVDKNRSRKLGGTGLGLAIVKNIMELHHAQITVESELGKGTSFKLNF